jgi:hypothetical protein
MHRLNISINPEGFGCRASIVTDTGGPPAEACAGEWTIPQRVLFDGPPAEACAGASWTQVLQRIERLVEDMLILHTTESEEKLTAYLEQAGFVRGTAA